VLATNKASDAAKRAQDARDAAAKLTEDIKAKQKTLDTQIEQVKAADRTLSAADKAAQRDTGGKAPNVKAPTAAAQTAVNAALSKRESAELALRPVDVPRRRGAVLVVRPARATGVVR
jgi:malate synthase